MTTLNFTLAQIETMIIKGTGRTINVQQRDRMLNDIKGMTEKDANSYLKLWSSMMWFNERMGGTRTKRCDRMYVIVSCNENKDAYINFLLSDVENTK